jgi:hypothetical protein
VRQREKQRVKCKEIERKEDKKERERVLRRSLPTAEPGAGIAEVTGAGRRQTTGEIQRGGGQGKGWSFEHALTWRRREQGRGETRKGRGIRSKRKKVTGSPARKIRKGTKDRAQVTRSVSE